MEYYCDKDLKNLVELERNGIYHNPCHVHYGDERTVFDMRAPIFDVYFIAERLHAEKRFLSGSMNVLSHSMNVLMHARITDQSFETQYLCLTHDVPEAYLHDIPGPLKEYMPCYKHIENLLYAQFLLDRGMTTISREAWDKVKEIDKMDPPYRSNWSVDDWTNELIYLEESMYVNH